MDVTKTTWVMMSMLVIGGFFMCRFFLETVQVCF